MDFSGVQAVMYCFKNIITNLPSDIYAILLIVFWLFITLSVIKVMSFKDG